MWIWRSIAGAMGTTSLTASSIGACAIQTNGAVDFRKSTRAGIHSLLALLEKNTGPDDLQNSGGWFAKNVDACFVKDCEEPN